MTIYHEITELIGQTPILKLNKLVSKELPEILLKMESYNPGGSIKDRICLEMIKTAEEKGFLKKGDTIVEPTSGNTGISLALVGKTKGYKVVLTMPDTMSIERQQLLKAFGATVILTPGSEGMKGAINKAKNLVQKNNNYYMPQQFENPANPNAHSQSTAQEILKDTDGNLDYFVTGVGTGGTITGIAKVLKNKIPNIKIIAVEPQEAAVLSGQAASSHDIQGLGAGFIPDILDLNLIDEIIKISSKQAKKVSKTLAEKEGVLAGISTGAQVAACLKIAKGLTKDKVILTIACDTGERYLSTNLFK